MRVWVVTAYTPYEGMDLVAIYNRQPTPDEMAKHRRDYSHREYVDAEAENVIE